MSDILKSAIAEAKVLKQIAVQNAKDMLLESFDQKVDGILSAKLQKEMNGEDSEDSEVTETEDPGKPDTFDAFGKKDQDVTPVLTEDDEEFPEEDEEDEATPEIPTEGAEGSLPEDVIPDEDDEEDLEFESILKELDDEVEDDKTNLSDVNPKLPVEDEEDLIVPPTEDEPVPTEGVEDVVPPVPDKDDDEDIDISELFEDDEQVPEVPDEEDKDDEEEPVLPTESIKELKNLRVANMKLKKAVRHREKVIGGLTEQMSQINLLNHKLAFTTKLFKQFNLSNESKMKIVETFDRAKSTREVKLIYATLHESLKSPVRKKVTIQSIKEGKGASKTVIGGGETSTILSEGSDLTKRFAKLANTEKYFDK